MMDFKGLENALSAAIENLIPALNPDKPDEYEMITLDRGETDNSRWLAHITPVLEGTKNFEIHCWNEEAEWIDLALRFGKLKDDPWKYGKIIVGNVTPAFVQMLLSQPKPTDIELENKMTPFFNVFLDNNFQSCHYGTELYIRSMR